MKTFLLWLAKSFVGLVVSFSVMAETMDSLILYYEEVEQGVGMQPMRYIVNDDFLRIDNGSDTDDYILFNVKENIIYSINHDDQTILKIENHAWVMPVFDFKVLNEESVMKDSPKVFNQQVTSYMVKAAGITCTQVSLVKDKYMREMQVFYQYQKVLSGQQVATLKNTPEELHTPCFLVDQIYHAGQYYKEGLPIHVGYSRGYEKFLRSTKHEKIDVKLFLKPEKYAEYSAAL